VGDALRLRALWRPYAVGVVLAAGIITEYLLALHAGWTIDEARALGFATLLASQPFLLLGMRSPDRPLWESGRPWTRTLTWVVAVLLVVTVAVVEFGPLAELLRLAPSTVSKHLSILRQGGFVDAQKIGRWMHYFIPDQPDPSVRQLLGWLSGALAKDKKVAEDAKWLKEILKEDPEEICRRQLRRSKSCSSAPAIPAGARLRKAGRAGSRAR
jgi:DNA-binding transcriptional ArsR family regulator